MSTKIFASILFIFLSSLICTKPKVIQREYVDLPMVDSLSYKECVVRYKSSLYDENLKLVFNVRIVYFQNLSFFDKITASTTYQDSVIIANLNQSYEGHGIGFYLNESKVESKQYIIEEFRNHVEEFKKDGIITVLVYSNAERVLYNGVAAGIPHTVMGIMENRLHTSTLPHEMGHILGAAHIFEKDDTDGRNAHSGDKICDTGSFNIMDNRTKDCGYIGPRKYSEDDLSIIVPNYMNYNAEDIDCRDKFTPIQGLSMRWHIENYPPLYNALIY